MKSIVAFFVILCCGFALGQGKDEGGDIKLKQPKNVKSSSAPVTRAEANKVFEKAWKSLAKGLKAKGNNPVKLAADGKPVSKNEVLAAMKAIVTQVEPMFKRSATPVAFKASRLRKDLDQVAYGKLIKDGFVMPVGPLVVGDNGSLTTYEFGDAVGVMLVRIADLVHLPSRKFTPALMKGG